MPGRARIRQQLERELNGMGSSSFYSRRDFLDDLDIVGELGGHTGCINALAWNTDGTLLASGSDDHRINIYRADANYSLNTRIETGHMGNIFSVKFMPGSGDRTLVSGAGDHQVRVFDIEYAPVSYAQPRRVEERSSTEHRVHRARIRRRGRSVSDNIYPGKLVQQNEVKRVYQSHYDMVKRIVTENNPHTFLTCSEDGSVRQFDLRQPSEYYARASYSNRPNYSSLSSELTSDWTENGHRPLLSYRKFGIDLNTMSLAHSQPWNLAVGGMHKYCFLHDRRYIGRDLLEEQGQSYTRLENDSERIDSATRCVKRFQPRRNEMQDDTNLHITGCKISEANPDELLVSWSGEGVYLFNMRYSPGRFETGNGREADDHSRTARVRREERANKRRKTETGMESVGVAAASVCDDVNGGSDSERELPSALRDDPPAERINELIPGGDMCRLEKLVVDIRREIFSYASLRLGPSLEGRLEAERRKCYEKAMRMAAVALMRMDPLSRRLDDIELEFLKQPSQGSREATRSLLRILAKDRRRTRLWVHLVGVVAYALSETENPQLEHLFASLEGYETLGKQATYRGRFLNLVCKFARHGSDHVKEFLRQQFEDDLPGNWNGNLEDLPDSGIDLYLKPPRQFLASYVSPLLDVETNRVIVENELDIVNSFKRVLSSSVGKDSATLEQKEYWGRGVARALLIKEGDDPSIDFSFIEEAFKDRRDQLWPTDHDDDRYTAIDSPEQDRDSDDESYQDWTDDDDDDDESQDARTRRFRKLPSPVEPQAPRWNHTKVYRGHTNIRTIKDVNFYGAEDEYVMSGSDCGHLFIWDKKTTELVQILLADDDTCNVAVGHPHKPIIAASGIDYTAKLFGSSQPQQREFELEASEASKRTAKRGLEYPVQGYAGDASRRRLQQRSPITSRNKMNNEREVMRPQTVSVSFADWLGLFGMEVVGGGDDSSDAGTEEEEEI